MADILQTIERYRALGIDQQIDYKKFYLYSIFPNVMTRLHNTNLQAEIDAFVASQEAGVPQGVLQGVPQDITALIKQNPKITREELAALLHVSVKTIGRRLAKLPHIKYVGSGYSGHWEIIEK